MYWSDILYVLTLILFVISMIISLSVRIRFKKFSKMQNVYRLTGAEAASRILQANGIFDVSIVPVAGTLTDNYDPRNKVLHLSDEVGGKASVAAVAVAAHECGHAIQDAVSYPLLGIRKSLVPICNVGSIGSYIAVILGFLFSSTGLITVGAILFSGIVAFHFVTLPVEVNASRRALAEVERLGLLSEEELRGGRKVLTAAGMTYFMSLVTSLVQFLRLLSLARR